MSRRIAVGGIASGSSSWARLVLNHHDAVIYVCMCGDVDGDGTFSTFVCILYGYTFI